LKSKCKCFAWLVERRYIQITKKPFCGQTVQDMKNPLANFHPQCVGFRLPEFRSMWMNAQKSWMLYIFLVQSVHRVHKAFYYTTSYKQNEKLFFHANSSLTSSYSFSNKKMSLILLRWALIMRRVVKVQYVTFLLKLILFYCMCVKGL